MKYCFLYPGQGAQFSGMGKDLWEQSAQVKELFTKVSDIMGLSMEKLLFEAPEEELGRTDLTQPAVTLVNLAVRIVLAEGGITSQGCAGFSLGEFAALEDAGVLSTEDLFKLVKQRGELMHRAGEKCGTGDKAPGMAAVVGLYHRKDRRAFPGGHRGNLSGQLQRPHPGRFGGNRRRFGPGGGSV